MIKPQSEKLPVFLDKRLKVSRFEQGNNFKSDSETPQFEEARLWRLGVRPVNGPHVTKHTGRVFTSAFLGRLASDNRKSRENSYFSDSRVGKLQ